MQNFENYLCERNDTIDNAAYQLIGVLTAEDPGASLEDDPATPNWDMAIIGEVVDAVKEIIIEKVGYTDADTDRDHDIKWFLDAVARVVDVAEDGKSFTFKPKAKQKYFERQYHAFLDKACELTGISLDAFVGEAKYDIGMAMYKLNEHYQDKFSLYVYFNDELKSLDEWIRETDLSGSFYFGGTLDYHY